MQTPSICTADEMQTEIGCLPGTVCPSCPAPTSPLLVDPVLMNHHACLYLDAGPPRADFPAGDHHLAGLLAPDCLRRELPPPLSLGLRFFPRQLGEDQRRQHGHQADADG